MMDLAIRAVKYPTVRVTAFIVPHRPDLSPTRLLHTDFGADVL
jgi:hypothetical protein